MKKVVRLVDNRSCTGGTVRELRKVLRGIDSGEITSLSLVYVRRNGSLKAYFDSECPIKALGSVELLKDYIKAKKFELS
jgi:hypothetical protein